MTIWKYTLSATGEQSVYMPQGAKVLYAAEQYGEIVIYAQVIPECALTRRTVWVHGTGDETQFSDFARSLGVVSLANGSLMFHVFVEPES